MFFTPILSRSAFVPSPRQVDARLERWLNSAVARQACAPASVALTQDDKAYTVSFDVPGVSKEQLTIGIESNVIRIDTVADAPRRYQLAYELPQDLDVATSEAKLELGVLTLRLGKAVPPTKVTQLPIA